MENFNREMSFLTDFRSFQKIFEVAKMTVVKFSKTCIFLFLFIYSVETAMVVFILVI